MNKAIQYREDGKFYLLQDVPTNPSLIIDYENKMKSCIAAGKEIINPEVLPGIVNDGGWHIYENEWRPLKPGDNFDCPDYVEFEDEYRNCKKAHCDDKEWCEDMGCQKPMQKIRLKLNKGVKQLQIDLWK